MAPPAGTPQPAATLPVLLFDDECAVCRRIAAWVTRAAHGKAGTPTLIVRGIGEDPDALHVLNPALEIWEAYRTVHLVLPDGSLLRGGEAIAEALRRLPGCAWFAWSFSIRIFGVQPAQRILDLGYRMLAELRPVLGCASCGAPSPWLRPLMWLRKPFDRAARSNRAPRKHGHFTAPAPVGGAPPRFPRP